MAWRPWTSRASSSCQIESATETCSGRDAACRRQAAEGEGGREAAAPARRSCAAALAVLWPAQREEVEDFLDNENRQIRVSVALGVQVACAVVIVAFDSWITLAVAGGLVVFCSCTCAGCFCPCFDDHI